MLRTASFPSGYAVKHTNNLKTHNMKKFTEEIQVTVTVNSIANMMLDAMNPEFKHRENVVESLISRMVAEDKQGLSLLYNTLSGFTSDINFNIGDIVKISKLSKYSNWGDQDSEGKYISTYKDITTVEVVDINEYADNKIQVKYTLYNSKREPVETTEWVNHLRCEFIGYAEDIKEFEAMAL
jgi:hypothetical protein